MLTPSLTVTAFTTLSTRRELPVKGDIKVTVEQKVNVDDVIGESIKEGDLYLVKVAEEIGIEPSKAIEVLTRKVGDFVLEGEQLALHRGLFGLFSTEVVSPVSGIIEFISPKSGHVGVRMPSTVISLKAFISGTVKEIEENKGCVIESCGGLIQGAFGVGGERIGKLRILNVSNDTALSMEHIGDEVSANDILVGGTNPSVDFFNKAKERGVVGIIVGGCDDTVLEEVSGKAHGVAVTGDEPITFTAILTEGFGAVPISQKVIDVVKKYEGRTASIQGMTQVRAGAVRPFVMISGIESSSEQIENVSASFEIGKRVRLIQMSRFGEQGTITELPVQPEKIATGAHVRVLRVALGSGQVITVPRANVEVLS